MPLRVQVRIYFKTNKVSNSVLLKKSGHFFLAACRFGADSLTFPGKFLDRSASWIMTTGINYFSTANSPTTSSNSPPWRCGTDLSLWLSYLLLSWSWKLRRVQLERQNNNCKNPSGAAWMSERLSCLPFPFFWDPGVTFTLCLRENKVR